MIGTIYFAYSPFSEDMICAKKNGIDKDDVMDYIVEIVKHEVIKFYEEKVSDDTYAYYLTYNGYKSPFSCFSHYYFSKAIYQKACREIAEYNKKIQLEGGLRPNDGKLVFHLFFNRSNQNRK